jgi:hypothetical protein
MANIITPFLAFTQDISVSFGLVMLVCLIVFAIVRRKSGSR